MIGHAKLPLDHLGHPGTGPDCTTKAIGFCPFGQQLREQGQFSFGQFRRSSLGRTDCKPALPSSRTAFIHLLTAISVTPKASATSACVQSARLSSSARNRRISFPSRVRINIFLMFTLYTMRAKPINAAIYKKENLVGSNDQVR
jgi:hypothetical protein